MNLLSPVEVKGVMFYKFNLPIEKNDNFLSHSYMIKSLTRSINKEDSKKISSGKSRKNILSKMRPAIRLGFLLARSCT